MIDAPSRQKKQYLRVFLCQGMHATVLQLHFDPPFWLYILIPKERWPHLIAILSETRAKHTTGKYVRSAKIIKIVVRIKVQQNCRD